MGASASLAGGTFDTPASEASDIYPTVDASGSTRFFHVGPMLQFFPITGGRFDPYASVGIGFRRVVDIAEVEGVDGEVKYWESGAGATLGAGIPIYVTDRVALGLRYDKSFSIEGKVCATIDGETPDGVGRCEDWSDRTNDLNTVDSRFVRLARPRPWTVAFELRLRLLVAERAKTRPARRRQSAMCKSIEVSAQPRWSQRCGHRVEVLIPSGGGAPVRGLDRSRRFAWPKRVSCNAFGFVCAAGRDQRFYFGRRLVRIHGSRDIRWIRRD